jgi:hypothetical protein
LAAAVSHSGVPRDCRVEGEPRAVVPPFVHYELPHVQGNHGWYPQQRRLEPIVDEHRCAGPCAVGMIHGTTVHVGGVTVDTVRNQRCAAVVVDGQIHSVCSGWHGACVALSPVEIALGSK